MLTPTLTHTLTCGQGSTSSHTSRHLNPLKQNTLTLYTKSHCALGSPRIYSHTTNKVSHFLLISHVSRLLFRCKVLCSAVSKPQDCSKHFYTLLPAFIYFSSCICTLVPADPFNRSPSWLLWEEFSHVAINAHRLVTTCTQILTTVYSQALIHIAE